MSARLDLLIRQGHLVGTDFEGVGDVGIANGLIVEMAAEIHTAAMFVIEAKDHFVLPGYIDAHVHLNEPGRESWEGFVTGTAALAAGGCTSFLDMPLNSTPVLDAGSFAAKAEALKRNSRLDGGIWGGLTPLNLEKLAELAEAGVIGFKAFMSNSGLAEFPRSDRATLQEGMARAAELHLPVAVHAESESLTARLSAAARERGGSGVQDYLDSRPIAAEVEAIGEALELAQATGCALQVVHVSSAEGLALIAAGKAEGLDVTAETCPHYLLLDEDDLLRIGAEAKCAPPLRARGEVERLWAAVREGRVDTIGSDHSPAPPEMKTSADFFEIWGGIAGCQHAYPLFVEEAIYQRGMAWPTVASLTAGNVARRFRLPGKGELKPGYDADLVLLQRGPARTIAAADLLTRHALSPYVGRSTELRVALTLARGRAVFGGADGVASYPARILHSTSR